MKTCFRCLESKSLDAFYKHAAMKDGHLNKCIECTKADANAHRQANLEHVRSYDRMRASQPLRIANTKAVISSWRKRFPERTAAHSKLSRAIKNGVVIPWPVCAIPECDGKPVAHHPDYSQPLDVVWLCQAHHKQAHALAA